MPPLADADGHIADLLISLLFSLLFVSVCVCTVHLLSSSSSSSSCRVGWTLSSPQCALTRFPVIIGCVWMPNRSLTLPACLPATLDSERSPALRQSTSTLNGWGERRNCSEHHRTE